MGSSRVYIELSYVVWKIKGVTNNLNDGSVVGLLKYPRHHVSKTVNQHNTWNQLLIIYTCAAVKIHPSKKDAHTHDSLEHWHGKVTSLISL